MSADWYSVNKIEGWGNSRKMVWRSIGCRQRLPDLPYGTRVFSDHAKPVDAVVGKIETVSPYHLQVWLYVPGSGHTQAGDFICKMDACHLTVLDLSDPDVVRRWLGVPPTEGLPF